MIYAKLCIKLFILFLLFWICTIADACLAGKEKREEWKRTKDYPPGIVFFTILTYISGFGAVISFALAIITWE